jgi:hypothetical protein
VLSFFCQGQIEPNPSDYLNIFLSGLREIVLFFTTAAISPRNSFSLCDPSGPLHLRSRQVSGCAKPNAPVSSHIHTNRTAKETAGLRAERRRLNQARGPLHQVARHRLNAGCVITSVPIDFAFRCFF